MRFLVNSFFKSTLKYILWNSLGTRGPNFTLAKKCPQFHPPSFSDFFEFEYPPWDWGLTILPPQFFKIWITKLAQSILYCRLPENNIRKNWEGEIGDRGWNWAPWFLFVLIIFCWSESAEKQLYNYEPSVKRRNYGYWTLQSVNAEYETIHCPRKKTLKIICGHSWRQHR